MKFRLVNGNIYHSNIRRSMDLGTIYFGYYVSKFNAFIGVKWNRGVEWRFGIKETFMYRYYEFGICPIPFIQFQIHFVISTSVAKDDERWSALWWAPYRRGITRIARMPIDFLAAVAAWVVLSAMQLNDDE